MWFRLYVEYEITQSERDFLRLHKLKLSMFELPRKCEKCSRDRFGFSNTEDLFWVVKDDGYRNTNYSVRYILLNFAIGATTTVLSTIHPILC